MKPPPRPLPSPPAEGTSPKRRQLKGPIGWTWKAIAAGFALFYLYTTAFGIFSVYSHRGTYVGVSLFLIFLLYPARKNSPLERPSFSDGLLSLLAIGVAAYWLYRIPTLTERVGLAPSVWDIVVGTVAAILCIEAGRRVLGLALPIIAVASILYTYLGPYFPGDLGHRGHSYESIISYSFGTLQGIFGPIASVCATVIFQFIIFGAFLEKTGAGSFLIRLAFSLTGRARGGPAKAAVFASGFMGMVNGSSTANVVSTGTFTIPLMKKAGYSPESSGAIEAASSLGGSLMPPIMGAGAFLIAEFTGTPYLEVVKIAFIPALLYFFSIFLMTHFEALKHDLKPADRSQVAPLFDLVKTGWYFLIPIIVLFGVLLKGYSPHYAALFAIIASFVLSFIKKQTRMSPGDLLDTLVLATRNSLVVGAVAGVVGIIIGSIFLSGLGLKVSELIYTWSMGYIPVAIVLTIFVSYVLGMAVTATSAYIMVVFLAAPALTQLGVPLLATHLLVFWYAQDSTITPPICLSAYAAAGISGGDPLKTGWLAHHYALALYIIPFLFVFSPILLTGPALSIAKTVVFACVGLAMYCAMVHGYFLAPTTLLERILLGVGAVALFIQSNAFNAAGFAILIAILFSHLKRKRSLKGSTPA
jgi:TRAP transporter 4TM/12TM fusion protein